jgi:hypothetical protein
MELIIKQPISSFKKCEQIGKESSTKSFTQKRRTKINRKQTLCRGQKGMAGL